MPSDARISWSISGDQRVAQGNDRIARSVEKIAAAERSAGHAAQARVRAQSGHGGGAGGHGGLGGAIHAISRGGGRSFGGHALHGLGNVASLSGGMMALGGTALAASIAIHAMEAASDRAAKAAMEETKARQELNHAIKTSVQAADTHAVGTFRSNEDAIRSLSGMQGGDSLVERAKGFADSNGPDGIKAFAMLARAGQLGNLQAVSAAGETGQVGVLGAAQALTSGKVRASGNVNQVAAAILSETTDRSTSAGDVERMRANHNGSLIGNRIDQFDFGEGRLTSAGIGRFQTSNSIYSSQRDEFDKLAHPEDSARRQVSEDIGEQLKVLAAGSAAEWAVVGLMKDLKALLTGGEGSIATQYQSLSRTLPNN